MSGEQRLSWGTLFLQGARALRRDIRNPHLVVVAGALVVAVAAMTAVATFTDRVQRALTLQASALLAADLAVNSSYAIPPLYRERAEQSQLRTSQLLSLRSMVTFSGGLQMVELKAVSRGYPLRGALLTAPSAYAAPTPANSGPAPGSVFVEARLLTLLKANVGDTLHLGNTTLNIAAVLVLEPDRAGDLFSIAPRVMMNLADVAATGLVAPGSRVQHSLLVAGSLAQVREYSAALPRNADLRIVKPSEARPEVRSALEHAQQFLSLAALVATTLSGLALLVAAHSFAAEQVEVIAILRTLGASRRAVGLRYSVELLLLGATASVAGALTGAVLELGLAHALSGWVQGALPAAALGPLIYSSVAGMFALIGFALPQLLALRDVPPARVLRHDLTWRPPRTSMLVSSAAAAIVLIAPWQAGDPKITAWSLAGLVACLVVLFACASAMLSAFRRWHRQSQHWWRSGLTNLTRRPALASLQICALGLSVMAIMLLSFVRTDLVASWAKSLPPGAPDQFLINIQAEQIPALEKFLTAHHLQSAGVYPMVRARLTRINEHDVVPEDYADPRARRLADREFNLSSAEQLKTDNRIVSGKFWHGGESPDQFSFEEEIAHSLGIKLGDHLTFRVADRTLSGEVTSLRQVNWETMEANFFVVSPPALLADLPATFITSFKLPNGEFSLLQNLATLFPSVTIIDVKALVQQVRAVMDKALAAIQFVFLFTAAAGLMVVFAAIQATQSERLHNATVMKTLGATRAKVLALTAVEFLALGVLAGTIGTLAASGAAWVLATRVFHIPYGFNPLAVAVGIGISVTAVLLAGLPAILRASYQPVAQVFREWT